MSDSTTAATFAPLVGETFRVSGDDSASFDLGLVTVEEHEPNPGAVRPEPFSLLFLGPQEPILPQAIYRFEHEALGELEMFIVPIARDESGTSYEAVFN